MIKLFTCLTMIVAMSSSLSLATLAADAPTIVTPDSVAWTAGTGPQTGAQVAVLEGDPNKPGPFTVRLKLPDGTKFGPHFHGETEHVTVISGTLLVGLGDTMDPSKMKALPAGSYIVVPSGLHHFAMAKGDTVIQIHGTGPSSMNMVGTMK